VKSKETVTTVHDRASSNTRTSLGSVSQYVLLLVLVQNISLSEMVTTCSELEVLSLR
jgi:hypothetical protein